MLEEENEDTSRGCFVVLSFQLKLKCKERYL